MQIIDQTTPSPPGSGAAEEGAPLYAGFLASARRFPERPALEVAGAVVSYEELADRAARLSSLLRERTPPEGAPNTAVFAYRSLPAFVGVLGSLLRGHAYVPLNPKFPPDRTRTMLQRADVRAVVVDEGSESVLEEVLEGVETRLLLVFADREDVAALRLRWPRHEVVGAADVASAERAAPVPILPDATAYLMFTSGSTGQPKGVQVLHRNVRHFLDLMVERWEVTEHDRLSQTFDMTFDLSVSDMFVAWERGACVCCPSAEQVLKPRAFIRDANLTIWYSVPSLGLLMKRLGMLKAGSYPGLRLSLFCGEALPLELAVAWAAAAPNSVVENVYGPTEVTISTTTYRFDPQVAVAEAEFDLVPIGWPHEGMDAIVVDGELEVAPGDVGELLLSGPQVTAGYWRDEEKTAAAFVALPGRGGVYYRTGDRVRRPVGDGPLTYLGRVDHQVKINGYRVELGEVESVLREMTGVGEVVAVAWPRTGAGYGGIVAFLRADTIDVAAVRAAVGTQLPDYMVPREIRLLDEMPLNSNGKFDRPALLATLEA